ncbi:HD domain-containing phosphohydrolase [uncultured Bdellovibrio sp.]|uniref:HD domain-containing phosphohydrolase n=1 Tax=Bdellovibrio sp. HCB-162 TaxID=3394234 RepID=UPI0025F00FFB|nr:HD domain-containing phosphohydrolase [uncultured Bdellovibrio sp.]
MKKILLVEDDNLFRSAVKSILGKKYEIIEANNGKMARELIIMSPPDLVISDIQMPHFSGVELLTWIKKNQPLPVILMTGFSQILETQQAHNLGADDFLAKPFKEDELTEKIKRIFKEEEAPAGPAVPVDLDKEFCKLPIEDFVSDKESDFAIYIRMTSSKYIKIAHQGGRLSPEKINTLREKGVTHLYIRQEDFGKLVGFTVLVSKAVSASGQVERAKKLRFMQYTGEMLVQQAFVQGTDEALFRNAKDFLTTSMNIMTEDQETFTMLEILSTHTDHLYTHSLGVSIFSVMIAKQLGWQSPQTLFKISLAGLFHDIGKKEIPKHILEKSRALLTQEERSLIETHPTRGKEILESLKNVPSEVIQVAYEHHEDVLGQGYPRGIDHKRIHPMTHIVAVANAFCNYTLPSPSNPRPLNAQEGFMAMKKYKENSLDSQCLSALSKVLKQQKAAS